MLLNFMNALFLFLNFQVLTWVLPTWDITAVCFFFSPHPMTILIKCDRIIWFKLAAFKLWTNVAYIHCITFLEKERGGDTTWFTGNS